MILNGKEQRTGAEMKLMVLQEERGSNVGARFELCVSLASPSLAPLHVIDLGVESELPYSTSSHSTFELPPHDSSTALYS